jgi:transposase
LKDLLRERFVPLDFDDFRAVKQNLCLDAGYTGKAKTVMNAGMIPHIHPRGEEKKAIELHGFRPKRWIIEVVHSWFNRFRRIHTRYEKSTVAYYGFLHLAAAMIVMRKIMSIYPESSNY